MVTLELRQIYVPPGQRVEVKGLSWEEFEKILTELGEKRPSRIAYSRGLLEIMTPLPEHEMTKVIVGDLIKVLLEELDLNFESLGSTTFKREDMDSGVEPDDCFYIRNYQQMIGKKRLDLTIDPPPDLALEIDLTSKTQIDAYQALGVPELWRVENGQLRIDVLEDGKYVQSMTGKIFPSLPIVQAIDEYLKSSQTVGRSQAIKSFRRWVREQNR